MKTRYLLPSSFKKIGWILLGLSAITGVMESYTGGITFLHHVRILAVYNSEITLFNESHEGFFRMVHIDLPFTIFNILFIAGGIFVAFARLRNEDEYIGKIRLESLLWATYINFILLFLTNIFIFGPVFFTVLIINMYTILILFIIRFHIVLYRSKKLMKNEE